MNSDSPGEPAKQTLIGASCNICSGRGAAISLSGQAGLAMSYHLRQRRQEHIVLERHRVAARWREHWDSLCLQGPNWNVRLPGFELKTDQPDAYSMRDDVARFIESCAGFIRAPLLGLHWMHKFTSAFLAGVGEDAEHLAMQIADARC